MNWPKSSDIPAQRQPQQRDSRSFNATAPKLAVTCPLSVVSVTEGRLQRFYVIRNSELALDCQAAGYRDDQFRSG
jgi:hypothetical protein